MGIITNNRKVLLLLVPASLFTLLIWLWRYRHKASLRAPLSKDAASRSGDVTKEISIASQMVGFVIGRQGSKVKELETQTNTKIRFREVSDGKVAMVTGQLECVEKAIEAIQMVVKEKNEKKQVKRVELVIPSHAIGRLIGKQGSNIVAMQKESGARISVDRGSGATRSCTITGNNDQVTRGVALVEQSLAESQAALHRSHLNKKLRDDGNKKYGEHRPQKSGHVKHHQPNITHLVPSTLPHCSDFFPAVVSHVTQRGHIWIQPISEGADALNNLCDGMTDLYSKMAVTDQQLMDPMIGSFCAAPFTVDGQWYRAQVVAIKSTTVHLLFVDYGDSEWHPIGALKVLFPQFCTLPIQATECELGGVAMPAGGWSSEAIQLIEEVTMCAKWDPVMVKVLDYSSKPPLVTIVNTSGDQDVSMSCELNRLIQSPDQDQLVCEEPITVEQVSQLESDMENALNHLDDQHTGQDDQLRLQDDGQDQQAGSNEVTHLKFLNTQNEDQRNGQVDQNEVVRVHQENGQGDQGYEVQAVNITFESSDSDDGDHVMVEYEEGGVVTSTSWTLHTPSV